MEIVKSGNAAMPLCWNRDTKPHRFCPGCGHGIFLKALGEAIDKLGIAQRVVFGCDIGCSLLAWDFFDVDSVQTHHGRTIPVMVGAKRANPDLIVVAYMGDGGGYAIGAQHLVNAAMRNEKITVLLANNTLYAMTGGQMAPTTLPGQKTGTTPYGRDAATTGQPTLGPEMAAAITGATSYIARGTVADYRSLCRYVQRALENQMAGQGFSFVEALSGCPTNWRTNAQQTWNRLDDEMTQYFPVGEIKVPNREGAMV